MAGVGLSELLHVLSEELLLQQSFCSVFGTSSPAGDFRCSIFRQSQSPVWVQVREVLGLLLYFALAAVSGGLADQPLLLVLPAHEARGLGVEALL